MRIWHDCLAEAHSRNNKKRLTDTEAGPARTGRNPKRPRWGSIPCHAGANDATDTLGGGRADESECPSPWWTDQELWWWAYGENRPEPRRLDLRNVHDA